MHAVAIEIVRCTTRDGQVRYQDRPCATGEAVQAIQLVDDLPRVPEMSVQVPADPASTQRDNVGTAAAAPMQAPVPVMASSWLCRRDDGSRYLSETGVGERRAVPLAMLGVPGRSLGDAYGRGGAGVSAPGVSQPGSIRSPGAQLGAAYTWVEDPCVTASGQEVCRFLEGEIEIAEKRLRYAFSDTSAQVRAELSALREQAAPCP